MNVVFIDTWAWIALALKRDQHHESAKQQHRQFVDEGKHYLTTDFILGETITQLYRLMPGNQAEKFITTVLAACDSNTYTLIHVSPAQFQSAWLLRKRFQDKPTISFVDLTSMVVMQERGIKEIFTGDADFQQVNLGFNLHPK